MNSGQGIVFLLGLLVILLTQTSCQKKPPTSIIVVTVDSLSVGDISCSQRPSSRSGLSALCEESVRFTHAYTPSILSAPALASLLTGQYPFVHGLHHNGAPGLSPLTKSLSEAAVEKKFRTAFFSGGPPIFRKTGLNQGFEVFDDGYVPSLEALFKPFSKSLISFEKWLDQEVQRSPFVAFFYVPDLAFLETKTVSSVGDTRSQSFESQLEELDFQLLNLIRSLKKRDLWRNSVFVFTGLQGRSTIPRRGELGPLNLHAENTQVPLFIKPPQKVRDTALSWTVDRNVSLIDVATTLFHFIEDSPVDSHEKFPSFSLKDALFKVGALPPEDRNILVESGWASWRGLGNLRVAAVKGQDYMIYDEKPKYYNLLTDRFELNPFPSTYGHRQMSLDIIADVQSAGFEKFKLRDNFKEEKFSIPYLTWVNADPYRSLHPSLQLLQRSHPKDLEFAQWLAASALENNDLKTFRKLADSWKNPAWLQSVQDPCWRLTQRSLIDSQEVKNCPEALFRDLLVWSKSDPKDSSKDWMRARLAQSYFNYLIEKKIFKTNLGLKDIWDLSVEAKWQPTYTDIFFSRGENQLLKGTLVRSLPAPQEE